MRLLVISQDFPPHVGGIQTYTLELAPVKTIVPRPHAVIVRAASRATMNAPRQVCRHDSSNAETSTSSDRPGWNPSTQYTTRSGLPRSRWIAVIASSTERSWVASHP